MKQQRISKKNQKQNIAHVPVPIESNYNDQDDYEDFLREQKKRQNLYKQVEQQDQYYEQAVKQEKAMVVKQYMKQNKNADVAYDYNGNLLVAQKNIYQGQIGGGKITSTKRNIANNQGGGQDINIGFKISDNHQNRNNNSNGNSKQEQRQNDQNNYRQTKNNIIEQQVFQHIPVENQDIVVVKNDNKQKKKSKKRLSYSDNESSDSDDQNDQYNNNNYNYNKPSQNDNKNYNDKQEQLKMQQQEPSSYNQMISNIQPSNGVTIIGNKGEILSGGYQNPNFDKNIGLNSNQNNNQNKPKQRMTRKEYQELVANGQNFVRNDNKPMQQQQQQQQQQQLQQQQQQQYLINNNNSSDFFSNNQKNTDIPIKNYYDNSALTKENLENIGLLQTQNQNFKQIQTQQKSNTQQQFSLYKQQQIEENKNNKQPTKRHTQTHSNQFKSKQQTQSRGSQQLNNGNIDMMNSNGKTQQKQINQYKPQKGYHPPFQQSQKPNKVQFQPTSYVEKQINKQEENKQNTKTLAKNGNIIVANQRMLNQLLCED